jgi:HEAT repeat protein
VLDDYRDQIFWQITSAQLLGLLEEPSAVEPLLELLLDPNKADAHVTALYSLVQIGAPSVQRAVKLLDGTDPRHPKFHDEVRDTHTRDALPPTEEALFLLATTVLGECGHKEGLEPLLIALRRTNTSNSRRARIADALTRIPATPASKEAVKRVMAGLDLKDTFGGRGDWAGSEHFSALAVLSERVGHFFDPSLAPWLLEEAKLHRGKRAHEVAFKVAAAFSALKLAAAADLAKVKDPLQRYSGALPKDEQTRYDRAYEKVERLVRECQDDVRCYLDAIENPESQQHGAEIVGVKAAYMIAVLGDARARDQLLERLDALDSAEVRSVAADAIDHLTPGGSRVVADKLRAMIERREQTADPLMVAADYPLRRVMYRVEARAAE